MSSAYDFIDHKILIEKLDYHGFRGDSRKLITSYLSDRKGYFEVQTFKFPVKELPPISVIQGSKKSSMYYSIYTSEVVYLYRIMSKPEEYKKITGKDRKIHWN